MDAVDLPLLEREAHLGRIDELIADALEGRGGVLSIEGPAGIGKTELLRAGRARAAAAGLRVLSARCGELERGMAFGVARQLLEVAAADGDRGGQETPLAGPADLARSALGLTPGPTATPSDPFAVLHGLYWVCANLCERGPLALAIDDAHWADLESLRWISYLARRLEGLPLLVLVATRPDEAGDARDVVRTMVADGIAEPIALVPLGPDGSRRVVRTRLEHADRDFCAACHRAARGNPLLLRELLSALLSAGVAGDAADAPGIEAVGAPSVARYVRARLERLGPDAVSLARAVAVLGTGGPLRQSARLAEIAFESAATVTDRLRASDLLGGDGDLEFVHPLVRSAVYADIPPSARSTAHGTAARIVAADGGSLDRVAAHLLATEPHDDPWVVQQLRAAARQALASGAPDAAAALLARALAEPPGAADRVDLLMECGAATYPVNPSGAVERFAEALDLTSDPARRAEIVRPLAKALGFADRPGEAVAVLDEALDAIGAVDEDRLRLVECERVQWGHFWFDNPERDTHRRRLADIADGLDGASVSRRTALGLHAWHLVLAETPVAETLAVARSALGPGRLFTDPEQGFDVPTLVAATHMYCDELDEAYRLFDQGVTELRDAGWMVHLIFTYAHRGHVRLRQGLLREAEADVTTAWDLAADLGPGFAGWWFAFGNLVQVLVARGDVAGAQHVVDGSGIGDRSPDAVIFPLPRVVRGQLHAARGDHDRAAAELLAAGEQLEARGFRNPSWSPWRIHVAPSLAAVGRTDDARRIAAEAVRRARRVGAPLALGSALRTLGQLEPADAGLACLAESVRVLEHAAARLERAHALVAYGSALRRAKRWGDARPPLREGLELATACGAQGLADRAREEIAAAGGRAQRRDDVGFAALTASELRVARRAADGLTNRHIAQDLFVTVKTVEKHLAGAYRKLDCARPGLPAALERP